MRNAGKFLYVACFCGALFGCGGGGSSESASPSVETPTSSVIPAPNPSNGQNYRTPEFNRNYGLGAINADAAYQRNYFGRGVTVGVIDTGVRTTHQELDGNVVAGRDFVFPGGAINDPDGHGTGVAAVIAGRQDNTGMHGVAPRARIMPLKIGDSAGNLVGNGFAAVSLAAISLRVPIINASFSLGSGIYGQYQGNSYFVRVPFFSGFDDGILNRLARASADAVGNSDTVVVWAAGNAGWNSETGVVRLSRCTGSLGPTNCPESDSPTVISRSEFIAGFNSQNYFDDEGNRIPGYGLLSTVAGTGVANVPSLNSLAPRSQSNLQNNWLAVVATDSSNRIASFSNGCGLARMWCLAAPGMTVFTAAAGNDAEYQRVNGTSFSAPHVSGALAVLKSRLPSMPMSVVRAILLTTATDLCATGGDCRDGVDEVYGWGLVNLDRAVRFSGGLQTASGVLLSDLQEGMPSEFLHLRGRLDGVSVAVKVVDGAYHNVALSEFARGGGGKNSDLGEAAKGMLAADYAAGESFRFWGGLSYDDSRSSFIGESDSVFSAANASDTNGWIRWTTADYGGLSAFGEWSHTQIDADYDSAAFISGIENARADGWTAGFRYADLFRYGDSLQISARQESRLSGGEMVISHSVAEGDFYRAFLGQESQTLRAETARIPIKEAAETIWAAGYSRKGDGEKWSAALEWNAATNEKGFSLAAEIDL